MIDEKLPEVFVDKHQMRRVFLNIIENASSSIEGLEGDKCLTVKTEGNKEGVTITISDTGTGIPKEHLAKIFEPFFTVGNSKKARELDWDCLLHIVLFTSTMAGFTPQVSPVQEQPLLLNCL